MQDIAINSLNTFWLYGFQYKLDIKIKESYYINIHSQHIIVITIGIAIIMGWSCYYDNNFGCKKKSYTQTHIHQRLIFMLFLLSKLNFNHDEL